MDIKSEEYDRIHWPWRVRQYPDGSWTYYTSALDRKKHVQQMKDTHALTVALDTPGLQVTVRRAIEKRLKELYR